MAGRLSIVVVTTLLLSLVAAGAQAAAPKSTGTRETKFLEIHTHGSEREYGTQLVESKTGDGVVGVTVDFVSLDGTWTYCTAGPTKNDAGPPFPLGALSGPEPGHAACTFEKWEVDKARADGGFGVVFAGSETYQPARCEVRSTIKLLPPSGGEC